MTSARGTARAAVGPGRIESSRRRQARAIGGIGGIGAIGVVIPAHDEEAAVAACLASVVAAASEPALEGVPVHIVVVCDSCTDNTVALVESLGFTALICTARNVGRARAIGARHALEKGADWLAFTDADTVVGPQWLVAQLAQQSDVVCGTIDVDDWDVYGDAMRLHFERTYTDADGHRHVHGANLGICARAYRRVGGFEDLANSEDVAIVNALSAAGARIAWSAAPRVVTSARPTFRATAGFGATLAAVAAAAGMLTPRPASTLHDEASTAAAAAVAADARPQDTPMAI